MRLEQADGTAWMAYYSLAMLGLAITLAGRDDVYEDMVVKFVEQFVMVLDALEASGSYDTDDGFFYDQILDGTATARPIRVQTLVGVIPALPATTVPIEHSVRVRRLRDRFAQRISRPGRDEIAAWRFKDSDGSRQLLVSVVTPDQLAHILAKLFDESAFLSPHGLRALSKRYTTPYELPGVPGAVIDYEPAESRTSMYGGNSNWRGPVWFPVNYLVIRALVAIRPSSSATNSRSSIRRDRANSTPSREIAADLTERLIGIWLPDPDGRRPVYGGIERLQTDPAWKDNLLFFEYFHGDNGAGLGAMHQTGWTALVADLIIDPPGTSRPMTPDL